MGAVVDIVKAAIDLDFNRLVAIGDGTGTHNTHRAIASGGDTAGGCYGKHRRLVIIQNGHIQTIGQQVTLHRRIGINSEGCPACPSVNVVVDGRHTNSFGGLAWGKPDTARGRPIIYPRLTDKVSGGVEGGDGDWLCREEGQHILQGFALIHLNAKPSRIGKGNADVTHLHLCRLASASKGIASPRNPAIHLHGDIGKLHSIHGGKAKLSLVALGWNLHGNIIGVGGISSVATRNHNPFNIIASDSHLHTQRISRDNRPRANGEGGGAIGSDIATASQRNFRLVVVVGHGDGLGGVEVNLGCTHILGTHHEGELRVVNAALVDVVVGGSQRQSRAVLVGGDGDRATRWGEVTPSHRRASHGGITDTHWAGLVLGDANGKGLTRALGNLGFIHHQAQHNHIGVHYATATSVECSRP